MRPRTIWISLFGLALAGAVSAQTSFSGELKCDKPDPAYKIDVGDKHALTLTKSRCTWPKPIHLGDSDTKDGLSIATGEVDGDKSSEKGHHEGTVASGDKYYVAYEGTAMLRDGAPQSVTGTYRFKGGTGKLKNLKGGGSYKGTPNADQSITFQVTGSYSIPK